MAGRSRVVTLPVAPNHAESAPAPALTTVVGRVVALERPGRVSVEYDGVSEPVPARYVAAVRLEQLREAAKYQQGVLLVFEGADILKPIVVGLLVDDEGSHALPAVHSLEASEPPSAPMVSEATARVDGKRVHVTASDEIVLECGEAAITLRRNGRVVIRGAYVETRARGTNRIKGGNVRIN
jgi:Domain of unknown function (DUF6484)